VQCDITAGERQPIGGFKNTGDSILSIDKHMRLSSGGKKEEKRQIHGDKLLTFYQPNIVLEEEKH
jgi:hypothetical protein